MDLKSIEEANIQRKKTGTTTVGIVCKDGIVLAADKRATAGHLIANKKEEKVQIVNDNLAITTAGLVSDVQLLTKLIKAQIKLIEVRNNKAVTVRQAANLMAGMVYSNIRRSTVFLSVVGFLLGGKDSQTFGLYDIGIDGSLSHIDEFASDGSGSPFALGVLENDYKKNLTVNEGVKLAVRAVDAAMQRDSASGNGIDVVTITKDGTKKVFEKELNTHITS